MRWITNTSVPSAVRTAVVWQVSISIGRKSMEASDG